MTMSEWENQPLGRKYVRFYSLLDSTDKGDLFTAYCDRHTVEMKDQQVVVKEDGALYKLQDPYRVYHCPHCLEAYAKEIGHTPEMVYKAMNMKSFWMWDDGEAPGDWFDYIGEFEDMEENIAFIE